MNIVREAVAGTLESSDVQVRVSPGGEGVQVEAQSVVLLQFGDELLRVTREVARELGVRNARISLNDRGALECTVRARLETALLRAAGDA